MSHEFVIFNIRKDIRDNLLNFTDLSNEKLKNQMAGGLNNE